MKKTLDKRRRGSILVSSVVLMGVLLLTGAAFIKWTADEHLQATYDLARSQAYYIAQKGVIHECWPFLNSKSITELPRSSQNLPEEAWVDYSTFSGRYKDVKVKNLADNTSSSVFVTMDAYDMSATGEVVISTGKNQPPISVERTVSLRAQMRTMANYMYLTDTETANPPDGSGDDVIWFYNGDTLQGRVHSNDYIGIKQRPVFLGPVSTSKDEFRENAANAYFEYTPVMEVAPVIFPEYADDVRNAAAASGRFFEDNHGAWMTMIEGNATGYHLVQWPRGTGPLPLPETITNEETIGYDINLVIFVEGDLLLKGNSIKQRSTVSCSGNMYLIDNVKYADVPTGRPEIPEGSANILGLISEENVVIGNTFENGRDNGLSIGPANDHLRKHIIITAGIVALNESFTFENQNDWILTPDGRQPIVADWDRGGYLFNNCNGQDRRGYIYVRGAVAQRRRGYVARSNCGRTGYDKDYQYDFRLQTNPPPVYLRSQDDEGNVFFDITTSWDHKPGNQNVR